MTAATAATTTDRRAHRSHREGPAGEALDLAEHLGALGQGLLVEPVGRDRELVGRGALHEDDLVVLAAFVGRHDADGPRRHGGGVDHDRPLVEGHGDRGRGLGVGAADDLARRLGRRGRVVAVVARAGAEQDKGGENKD